jgi:hypothetical protein
LVDGSFALATPGTSFSARFSLHVDGES